MAAQNVLKISPKQFGADELSKEILKLLEKPWNRLLKANPSIAITNSRKIVDARNYIIHGYDSLSVDILWSIVINHLPKLQEEVSGLLREEG